MDNILEMHNINKSFFGVPVLYNAQLSVKRGEVHVLLGENGAGKSTMIKILSGAYSREDGAKIILDGKELPVMTPKQALDSGISVIYQEFNLVPYLPIFENIYIGKEFMKTKGILDHKKAIAESKKYMDMIGLNIDPRINVENLSVAQKQMVEISKALSNDAKVIVMDEPTAAITAVETEALFKIVRKLKEQGIGIIYISHRMSELFEIGDRVTVMRDGAYVDTKELCDTTEQELTKMMVGRNINFNKLKNLSLCPDEISMEVKNICYKNLVKNVSFDLHKGEIFGISGLVGAGRTELAKCIIGAYRRNTTGEVFVKGEKLVGGIAKRIKRGVVYLSEDRKDEGLSLDHTLRENIALPNLDKFTHPFLDQKAIARASEEHIKKLHIKTPNDLLEAKNLSGGNQQKVVVAKWLLNDADIYIFDEPTRGIDVGARSDIYQIMHDLTAAGDSVLVISSDLVELLKICDRIAVMREGEMVVTLDNDEDISEEKIMSYTLNGGNIDE